MTLRMRHRLLLRLLLLQPEGGFAADAPHVAFWKRLGASLRASPCPPRAILVSSAHHGHPSGPELAFASPNNFAQYDFGMPQRALYSKIYAPPGDAALAERAAGLLRAAGLSPAVASGRGLDHGAWVPLSRIFPQADIPVVQVSIRPKGSPAYHLALGAALAPLAREGVLLVGSGAATHDLRGMEWADFENPSLGPEEAAERAPGEPYARFEAWLAAALEGGRVGELLDWAAAAPHPARNHPTAEHFLPLFVPLGAAAALNAAAAAGGALPAAADDCAAAAAVGLNGPAGLEELGRLAAGALAPAEVLYRGWQFRNGSLMAARFKVRTPGGSEFEA